MGSRSVRAAVAVVLAGLVVVNCSRPSPPEAPSHPPRITLVIYGTTGNPFWAKVTSGAGEAARNTGAKLDVQFAANDPVQANTIIETAVAAGAAGVGLVIDQPAAYDAIVRAARLKGVPVVAFNIDDPSPDPLHGRQAFIGQRFETAGYVLGRRLVQDGLVKPHDVAVCPVEHPEATYAVQRHAGVERALAAVGAHCEVVNTGGVGLEDTLTKLSQYLVGHPHTAAVIGLGGMPTEVAPQAIAESRLNIPNAGFDLTPAILKNIAAGRTLATVDQQPFYQGYFTVTELIYAAKYGLTPVDINTGSVLVDRSNVAAALQHAGTVR